MGRTPKPLTILITDPEILEWPQIQALKAQGHVIGSWVDLRQGQVELERADLILGPTCWRMTPLHRKYLSVAVAAARGVKYPKKEVTS